MSVRTCISEVNWYVDETEISNEWEAAANEDTALEHLKGHFDPPFDFHMEYVKPLHGKSKTTLKWLMYGFIL